MGDREITLKLSVDQALLVEDEAEVILNSELTQESDLKAWEAVRSDLRTQLDKALPERAFARD